MLAPTAPRSRTLALALVSLLAPLAPASAGSPEMVVDPVSLGFAERLIGTTSDYQWINIHNGGESTLDYTITIPYGNTNDFTVTCWGGGTECLAGTVPPLSTVYAIAYFHPTLEGQREATVMVSGDDWHNPADEVALYGIGKGIFGNGFESGDGSAWSDCQAVCP